MKKIGLLIDDGHCYVIQTNRGTFSLMGSVLADILADPPENLTAGSIEVAESLDGKDEA